MYCKNCSVGLDPQASVCTNCGAPKGAGENYCPNCAIQVAPGTAFCLNCGASTSVAAAKPKTPGTSIASLILGILSLLCCSYGLGVIMGPIALICAGKTKKVLGNRDGLATAGFICGLIGTILSAIAAVFWILYILGIGGMMFMEEFMYF